MTTQQQSPDHHNHSGHADHTDYAEQAEQRKTVRELIEKSRFAMITTTDERGAMVSRPMTVQEVTDDGDIIFIVPKDGDAAQQADGSQVNLGFTKDMSFVSVAGCGEIREDKQKLEELWGPGTEAFSTKDETPDNTNRVLLVIHGESAQYWDSPSKPALAVGLIKGIIAGKSGESGDRPSGDSGTVEL